MPANSRTARTRANIAASAATVVAISGVSGLTIAAVSRQTGLSRATIHNHVRSRDELLDLVTAELLSAGLAQLSAGNPSQLLQRLADWVAAEPVIAGLRKHDPALLQVGITTLLQLPDSVTVPATDVLLQQGLAADLVSIETILRWLSSYALLPGTANERATAAGIMAAALQMDARL